METKNIYSVAVLGFNQTEKMVLSSIFGLSARRTPTFGMVKPDQTEPADLYLVDADSVAAVEEFKSCAVDSRHPAILIGAHNHGMRWPLLARPLQLTRLFKAFDLAIEDASAAAGTAAPAPPAATRAAASPAAFAGALRISTPPPGHAVQLDWALVVDDNATVREFMRGKLAPFKINVDFAESGEEAIGMTSKRQYTCVFLDVVMPGMDGYQVCKLIKQRKNVKKSAVVMLTSKGSPFDRIRGTMAGCDSYLTKPVDEDKLLETIVKYLPQN